MWSSSDGSVRVCVCVCAKEYWALSSQMSAEQSLCTITSGHLGPINTASKLQLCLFFFVCYCLFIIVLSLESISSPSSLFVLIPFFLVAHSCFFSFPFFLTASCMHNFVCLFPSLSSCTAPAPEHLHLTVAVSAHTYTLFFSPQLVATLLSLPLPLLLLLLSLVTPFDSCQNITSSLCAGSKNYLLFKCFCFF